MTNQELQVRIETEGGGLTLTPTGLLQYFLPDAKPMPDRPNVFVGHKPGQPNEPCYVQVEALAGMLFEAREKHLNPVSGMYLIPSNHPDKPAGSKVKYTEPLTRARNIPGFLGMNAGLIVKRGKEFVETHGTVPFEGDVIIGAWAEAYLRGLPRPIRHEVPKQGFWGSGLNWNQKGGWMLCKVAMDQLAKLKLGALAADDDTTEEPQNNPDDIVLEARPVPPSEMTESGKQQPKTQPQEELEEPAFEFLPDTLYPGTLILLSPREGRKPGKMIVRTEYDDLELSFWERPKDLKERMVDGKAVAIALEEWPSLLHSPVEVSFAPDKNGFPMLKAFSMAPRLTEREPGED